MSYRLEISAIVAVLVAGSSCTCFAQVEEGATQDTAGLIVHSLRSDFQPGETSIRVLVPKRMKEGQRFPVVYILPVEAGAGTRWGDGLAEAGKHGVSDRFGLICVAPTFSQLPWYADHPSDLQIRQESHFLKSVVPFVDEHYPTEAEPDGRLLLGFSKSGWGAFSLLLRQPDMFGRAVAWDAPLMMDGPGRYGSGPIFGSKANFAGYEIAGLLRNRAAQLQDERRLSHFGYGNFREHHEAAHQLMNELGIQHVYRDGPKREHSWHSGWLPEAVEMLMADRRLE